jgi:hypothetical protein
MKNDIPAGGAACPVVATRSSRPEPEASNVAAQ